MRGIPAAKNSQQPRYITRDYGSFALSNVKTQRYDESPSAQPLRVPSTAHHHL